MYFCKTASTRRRGLGLIFCLLFITRETVAMETFASLAMS